MVVFDYPCYPIGKTRITSPFKVTKELYTSKPVVAAFDFDGTLTRRDSFLPFLLHVAGTPLFMMKMLALTPVFAGLTLGLLDRDSAKAAVIASFLTDRSLRAIRSQAESFVQLVLPRLVNRKAIERFRWHRLRGDRCVLVSASPEVYLRPWAMSVGFDDVIGTVLEVGSEGLLTGRLQGKNCRGEEKVRRLELLIGPLEQYIIYAYGDSSSDKPLLSVSQHAYYRRIP